MIKSLTQHGNSMALVIEKPILELLGADSKTLFEITTDGKVLILAPIKNKTHKKKVKDAIEKAKKLHHDVLKKLAE